MGKIVDIFEGLFERASEELSEGSFIAWLMNAYYLFAEYFERYEEEQDLNVYDVIEELEDLLKEAVYEDQVYYNL